MAFQNAETAGSRFAAQCIRASNYENLEDVIFLAMEVNPYKSKHTRAAFNRGASDWVNMIGRIRTREMNGETYASE